MSKRSISITNAAWSDYLEWQKLDRKIVRKINRLLGEISRTPYEGTGKPEPLRENLDGYWSRRITDEHRLVYLVNDDEIRLITCRHHY